MSSWKGGLFNEKKKIKKICFTKTQNNLGFKRNYNTNKLWKLKAYWAKGLWNFNCKTMKIFTCEAYEDDAATRKSASNSFTCFRFDNFGVKFSSRYGTRHSPAPKCSTYEDNAFTRKSTSNSFTCFRFDEFGVKELYIHQHPLALLVVLIFIFICIFSATNYERRWRSMQV